MFSKTILAQKKKVTPHMRRAGAILRENRALLNELLIFFSPKLHKNPGSATTSSLINFRATSAKYLVGTTINTHRNYGSFCVVIALTMCLKTIYKIYASMKLFLRQFYSYHFQICNLDS